MMPVQPLGETPQHRLVGIGGDAVDDQLAAGDAEDQPAPLFEQPRGGRVTPATAASSDGCPSGYIACLCSAIDSSIRNSLSSRDSGHAGA